METEGERGGGQSLFYFLCLRKKRAAARVIQMVHGSEKGSEQLTTLIFADD